MCEFIFFLSSLFVFLPFFLNEFSMFQSFKIEKKNNEKDLSCIVDEIINFGKRTKLRDRYGNGIAMEFIMVYVYCLCSYAIYRCFIWFIRTDHLIWLNVNILRFFNRYSLFGFSLIAVTSSSTNFCICFGLRINVSRS